MNTKEPTFLLAACGINCNVCYAHLRKKKTCPGCKAVSIIKPKHCLHCSIKNCDELKNTGSQFCFSCKKFPCQRLKLLDKRYKLKYRWSLLDNLHQIQTIGIDRFWAMDMKGWTCLKCGNLISIHSGVCEACGEARFYSQQTR